MTVINDPGCTVVNSNTGLPDCPLNPDKIVGLILLDKDKVFTENEQSTVALFIAALQAATVAEGEARIYPIFRFDGMTDNSEDAVKTTSGYGAETFVRDGKYKLTFDMHIGGHQLQQKLRAYNKSKKKVLLVDDSGVVYGTLTSAGLLTGLSLDYFNAKPFKFNDGTNPATYSLEICLSKPAEINENIGYIKTDQDIEEVVKGITDVTLTQIAAVTTYVTVKVKTTDDSIDLYDVYSGNMDEVTAWVVKNALGVVVTPSAVAVDAVNKGIKITATLTAGTYTVQMAPAATLRATPIFMGVAPAGGFESNILSFRTS